MSLNGLMLVEKLRLGWEFLYGWRSLGWEHLQWSFLGGEAGRRYGAAVEESWR